MPSMDRQTPDPLKLMRQKQKAEAKKLAAEHRQRSGMLKEQAKIREAEAAEKAANAERLNPPRPWTPVEKHLTQRTSCPTTLVEQQITHRNNSSTHSHGYQLLRKRGTPRVQAPPEQTLKTKSSSQTK